MIKSLSHLSICVCAAVFLLVSCKHESIAQIALDQQSPAVCFEDDILPIYQSYCAKSGCHNESSHREGYTLTSYETIISKGINAGNAFSSSLYTVLNASGESRMPPPGSPSLTNEQIVLIRKWINQGAANTTNCAAVCDSMSFAYNADVKPIMDQYCTGCHGGTSPQGGFVLDTYAAVKEFVDGDPFTFMGTINQEPGYIAMPKPPAGKLSDCNIAKIRKWIEAGAPEN